ncbi:helix-turn-helix domain-containing protein [Mycolicibacterium wolinskyi]|uniref:IclR family transcriptional regulator n=1 Tax=Mycolicibacterium TaxID=1866885 RepID=UPI000A153437|nr:MULTISPECIES: helix-turn-helix domain-containing protein [Mycolicibacterium]MCV7286296.1 helix-turn-helix domain-containing protein [Mycolicibacterium wolinskyi]MCV7293276.1 helix-turn-helix domain-containing protein [Mycolicibacterium goodii]
MTSPGSPAVHRAARVLAELAANPHGVSVPELARRLGTAKSSVSDLVSTLLLERAVTRDEQGTVRLGVRIAEIARGFVGGTRLIEEFRPACARISELDGAAVVLAVLVGGDIAHVAVREGDRPLPLTLTPGMRLPAWSTATGIALLTDLPDVVVDRLYQNEPAASPSGLIFDADRLLLARKACRTRGWASNEGVEEMTLAGTAAVVVVDGRPLAAVGVVRAQGSARHATDAAAIGRLAHELASRA